MASKLEFSLPNDTDILIRRRYQASPRQLWEMWSKPEHLRNWWGPHGWSLPVCEVDFRIGGQWFYCMEGPDDMTSCGKAIYQELDEPNRIVHVDIFVDADGNELEGMPVAQNIIDFIAENGETIVHGITRYENKEQRDAVVEMGVEVGVTQTFDRLEAYLTSLD